MHKGRLLDQAMILFICVPFQNGNCYQRKEFAPRGSEFFSFMSSSVLYEKSLYHIEGPPLNVTIFITHVRYLRNGCFCLFVL